MQTVQTVQIVQMVMVLKGNQRHILNPLLTLYPIGTAESIFGSPGFWDLIIPLPPTEPMTNYEFLLLLIFSVRGSRQNHQNDRKRWTTHEYALRFRNWASTDSSIKDAKRIAKTFTQLISELFTYIRYLLLLFIFVVITLPSVIVWENIE